MDLEKIKNDIIPIIEECGLSLYSFEYRKESGSNVLEIQVDKKGFADMDDIEKVTEKINEYLDKTDPIDEEYNLSIMSRGCEKEFDFDDCSYYKGEWVEVKTMDQLHTGELLDYSTNSVTIKNIKNKKAKINVNDILTMKTVIKF